jgi:hypothetical protein
MRGGRKDFLRDIRSVIGSGMDEGDGRRAAMARSLSTLFETEWAFVARAADSEPPRRPAAQSIAEDEVGDANKEEGRRDAEEGAGKRNWRQECAEVLRRWGRNQCAWILPEDSGIGEARGSVTDAAAQVRNI